MSLFPHVSFAAMSDIGRKRKNNEDACYASPSYGVWVVSDGMGGGDDGEVASLATVQGIDAFVKAHPFPANGTWNLGDLVTGLSRAVSGSSAWIYARAREKHLKGCGATFVALLLDAAHPQDAVALHAGDSRLYRIRGRSIQQITKDHSAAEMIGVKNEAEINPMFRGMILRAVGIQPSVELERTDVPLKAGDWVLLCSDGLSRMVPEKQMLAIVREAETPDDGVRNLIFAANDAGGIDNVTVILVKIGDFPPPVASFPLVLTDGPSEVSASALPEPLTSDTSESMTFSTHSCDDPVTGSVTESAMTFDEAVLEDEGSKTRETAAAIPVAAGATPPVAAESAPIQAVAQERGASGDHEEQGTSAEEPGREKTSQGRIAVIVAVAALLAALLAAALTWFVMKKGPGVGVAGTVAQASR